MKLTERFFHFLSAPPLNSFFSIRGSRLKSYCATHRRLEFGIVQSSSRASPREVPIRQERRLVLIFSPIDFGLNLSSYGS